MRQRNRLALIAGALLTAVVYVLLSLVPLVSPTVKSFVFDLTGHWMFGDPLKQARVLGGVPGGFVVGYLARDTFDLDNPNTAVKFALYAVTSGLGLAYVATVLLTVALYGTALVLWVAPTFVVVVPFYLLGGSIGGLLGNGLRATLDDSPAPVTDGWRGDD